MTLKFKNIYLNNTSVVAGPILNEGPLRSHFDYIYNDYYDNEKTFEDCEIKEGIRSIEILLKKENKKPKDIDIMFGVDLSNQLIISNFIARKLGIPYFGVYNACASFCEELTLAAALLSNKDVNNIICFTSSNNLTSERQFRNPVEYGGLKPDYSTFTVSSATSCLISKNKSNIKIESSTIGKVFDLEISDAFDMGSAMSPAAAITLHDHLNETNRETDYYDFIITGDLGKYGEKIFKKYCKEEYNYELKNYLDSAVYIFNKDDKRVMAGGSGPSCLPTYLFSKIIPDMNNKKIKKVLLLATGALYSSTTVNQKKSIPCICHAISLEVI